MQIRTKDPCPCGSGKKYKHCCMDHDKKRGRGRQLLIYAIPLLVIVLGLILWSRNQPNTPLGQLISGTAAGPSGQAAQDQSLPADGNPPDAWEDDGEKNRYYDPNHGHWHNGPPPPESQRAGVNIPSVGSNATNPAIPNPQPYQYDPTTNRYWDPGHSHWHPGQPPAAGQRTTSNVTQSATPSVITTNRQTPNISNPTPFQYDAATNQYWDPAHGHWHSGQPPTGQDSPAGQGSP